jgi:hypothetical protein
VAVIQFVQLLSSSVTTLVVVRRPIELIGGGTIALKRKEISRFSPSSRHDCALLRYQTLFKQWSRQEGL